MCRLDRRCQLQISIREVFCRTKGNWTPTLKSRMGTLDSIPLLIVGTRPSTAESITLWLPLGSSADVRLGIDGESLYDPEYGVVDDNIKMR